MLAIAISTFFILALFGAVSVIGMMFWQYRAKIEAVVGHGLGIEKKAETNRVARIRSQAMPPRQVMRLHRNLQPAVLRAAA